jgi:hypothetical protein
VCTVTWVHNASGYELFCNRDEMRMRGIALAPKITNRDGVRALAPVDADCGGTWIGVNEFGLSICLLNGPDTASSQQAGSVSRGLLLHELLEKPSLESVCRKLASTDLSFFRPFTLVIIEVGGRVVLVEWSGSEMGIVRNARDRLPLTSSSFDNRIAHDERHAEYLRLIRAEGQLTPGTLNAFHHSHTGTLGAYSPCMHRIDAETVSFSRIIVNRSEATFIYTSGPPCMGRPNSTSKLPLGARLPSTIDLLA